MHTSAHHHRKLTKLRITQGVVTLLIIIAALVSSVMSANKIQEFLTRATAEPANIVVNADANLGRLEKPWRNLAQGGEDHNWRLQPLVAPVRSLNPEYIRIDHVFDFYDIVKGESGNLQFDYSKLDLLLNDIQAAVN